MKWSIPAKTFLMGEYAAITGESAILLTTNPCFQLSLEDTQSELSKAIHPQSPAGLLLQNNGLMNNNLIWHDPYHSKGGLGASSAQFIAAFLTGSFINQQPAMLGSLLKEYYHYAWKEQGLKPSGYDVIAQTQNTCVFINKNKEQIEIIPWNFSDLGFLLVHTGKKLATHCHLQETALPSNIKILASIVNEAKRAFINHDARQLINTVNEYHQQLTQLKLVANHSIKLIKAIKEDKRVLAVKGCGAMGADVILIVSHEKNLEALGQACQTKGMVSLATHHNLYQGQNSFEKCLI